MSPALEKDGVTMICAAEGVLEEFTVMKEGISLTPDAPNPILVFELIQL